MEKWEKPVLSILSVSKTKDNGEIIDLSVTGLNSEDSGNFGGGNGKNCSHGSCSSDDNNNNGNGESDGESDSDSASESNNG